MSGKARAFLVGHLEFGVQVVAVEPNHRRKVRCQRCGRAYSVRAITLTQRRWRRNERKGCHDCVNADLGNERMKPLLCRTCGTKDPKKMECASECMACARAACRNGRCECGRAIRHERGGAAKWGNAHPIAPCYCGNPWPLPV